MLEIWNTDRKRKEKGVRVIYVLSYSVGEVAIPDKGVLRGI